ncbi:hypothetical protein AGMMS50222_02270 [Endomicrobiia bacterium]|nr:hypothetical protein AGMMS49531_03040 [Endomicrobiia bacterium]GHT63670.1 hypothetical protein AGMMS49556_00540 [Endomicrobiia bacterium]GHT69621.1 hypothetical protein AGMMS49950_02720 [Endomicrobiia bacterium]GHT73941.1 hypothetical protein AGMMS50222_02270 [Endomicrobiia bacterium]
MKDFKQATAAQIKSDNDKQEVEKHKEELAIEKKAWQKLKAKHLSLLAKQSAYARLKAQSKNKDLSI